MTLQLLHSEYPYIYMGKKLIFFFISVGGGGGEEVIRWMIIALKESCWHPFQGSCVLCICIAPSAEQNGGVVSSLKFKI